jgi:hypothetical protein
VRFRIDVRIAAQLRDEARDVLPDRRRFIHTHVVLVARLVIVRLGDDLARDQLLAPLQLALREPDVGLGRFQILLAGTIGGLQADDLVAAVLHVGAGLVDRDLQRLGIELEQHVALLHRLVLVHLELDDAAGDVGAHRHLVGVDIGVVGIGIAPAVEIDDADADQHGERPADHQQATQPAPAVRLGLRRFHGSSLGHGLRSIRHFGSSW